MRAGEKGLGWWTLGCYRHFNNIKRGCGVQVMKFWVKAERVVAYKNKSAADARKKEVMDKHLTFLVGQTQRYSSMLAQRLTTGTHRLISWPCL